MIILGLDQASNKTGFSIFNNEELIISGVFDIHDINRDKNGELFYQEKVLNVKMFLERIIKEYNIDLVIIEDIQKQVNQLTYKQLAWLQGVLIQYMYENNIKFSILKPSEWRTNTLHIKGRKREILKKNTQSYIKDKFGIEASEDEADAIGIGFASVKLLNKNKLKVYCDEVH